MLGTLFGKETWAAGAVSTVVAELQGFDPSHLIAPAKGPAEGCSKQLSWTTAKGNKITVGGGRGPSVLIESSESSESSGSSSDESSDSESLSDMQEKHEHDMRLLSGNSATAFNKMNLSEYLDYFNDLPLCPDCENLESYDEPPPEVQKSLEEHE